MNRTIKFRAWDKQTSIMWDWKNLKALSFLGIEKEPYLELMQFTGLTDRNGKDIYEGDIVDITQRLDDYVVYAKVTWNDEAAAFGYEKSDSNETEIGTLEQIYDSDTKIIGNIYSNPELLNP